MMKEKFEINIKLLSVAVSGGEVISTDLILLDFNN